MENTMLTGKVVTQGTIRLLTGMRVGGSSGGLRIGGIDLPVIKDADGVPYVPGSSLKGKLRSLFEVAHLSKDEFHPKSGLHACGPERYASCPSCLIWGIAVAGGEYGVPTLTRLVVRDAPLVRSSVEKFRDNLELAWTEVKTEVNIDRVSGTVSRVGGPRNPERVPAGAEFAVELVFNAYGEDDKGLLKYVFEAMCLLEDDYLGGMGSRGYGKVKFENIRVWWNTAKDYGDGNVDLSTKPAVNGEMATPSLLVRGFDALKVKLT